ncbi:Ig-like domain-containing protein [Thermococcus gorgonarius]|uniref:DUF4129 domain-containing protein n=1 Tax=Thermococcus gorgonarius TaxID=71997 RepID=A0A2Z2M8I8_THEGO|nr:hypothetical protein [Thermococcus gorgonarius]ASJ01659.1 hypothetical protein A3K92_09290 [Thermococcus gorgonarius]
MRSWGVAKFLTVVIIVLLILPPAGARGVEKPVPHDEFLYQYFSHTLEKFAYSLRYTYYEGNDYGLTLAENTRSELLQIMMEGKIYREKGIKARVFEVLPPFYNFSVELVTLDRLLLSFQENNQSPGLAMGIVNIITRMNGYIEEIKSMELYNGTEILRFDTGEVEKYLNEIRTAAEKILNQTFEVPTQPQNQNQTQNQIRIIGLSLYVTNKNPIVNQSVTFFGTAPLNESVAIIILDENGLERGIVVPVSRHFFTLSYRFTNPGKYFVKAVQGNLSTEWLEIDVRKIPTYFLITSPTSAIVNTTLTLKAVLVDYYSNPLPEREITVNGTPFITDSNGTVAFDLKSSREASFQITLEFQGDEFHEGTSKVVTAEFTRIPTTITITGPGTVEAGKTFEIRGSISPAINSTVEIYVNDQPYAIVNSTNGLFSVNMTHETVETLKIYAVFNGTELYLPSKSNVLLVSVVAVEDNLLRYLAVILIVAGLVTYSQRDRLFRKRTRHEEAPEGTEALPEPSQETPAKLEIPKDVGEAYSLIRDLLFRRMGIPKNLTPRETLEKLKGWEGYESLKTLTSIHEKAVYKKETPTKAELQAFKKAAEAVITALGGTG